MLFIRGVHESFLLDGKSIDKVKMTAHGTTRNWGALYNTIKNEYFFLDIGAPR